MAVQNLKMTTKNLLGVVVNLPKNEFERFVSDARKLKKREEILLSKLQTFDLSSEEREIYIQFQRKFQAENISDEEHRQMLNLTDKLESLNVERLKCLVEIAGIRQKTLPEVMKQLDIKPRSYE